MITKYKSKIKRKEEPTKQPIEDFLKSMKTLYELKAKKCTRPIDLYFWNGRLAMIEDLQKYLAN